MGVLHPQTPALPYDVLACATPLRSLVAAKAGLQVWPLPPPPALLPSLQEVVLRGNSAIR
jgi:hypothetical protein